MRTIIWIFLTLNLFFLQDLLCQIVSKSENLIGSQAPEWTLTDTYGKIHKNTDYKGKLMLVEFWGTYCSTCVKSINDINEIDSKYKSKNLVVISILQGGINPKPFEPLTDFKQKYNINYIALIDGEKYFTCYKVKGVPTFYLIDKKGKVIYSHLGKLDDTLKSQLTELIEKSL